MTVRNTECVTRLTTSGGAAQTWYRDEPGTSAKEQDSRTPGGGLPGVTLSVACSPYPRSMVAGEWTWTVSPKSEQTGALAHVSARLDVSGLTRAEPYRAVQSAMNQIGMAKITNPERTVLGQTRWLLQRVILELTFQTDPDAGAEVVLIEASAWGLFDGGARQGIMKLIRALAQPEV